MRRCRSATVVEVAVFATVMHSVPSRLRKRRIIASRRLGFAAAVWLRRWESSLCGRRRRRRGEARKEEEEEEEEEEEMGEEIPTMTYGDGGGGGSC
jgi:hypothetical protein